MIEVLSSQFIVQTRYICHPAGGKPYEPDKATLTGIYAIQQMAGHVSQTRLS